MSMSQELSEKLGCDAYLTGTKVCVCVCFLNINDEVIRKKGIRVFLVECSQICKGKQHAL